MMYGNASSPGLTPTKDLNDLPMPSLSNAHSDWTRTSTTPTLPTTMLWTSRSALILIAPKLASTLRHCCFSSCRPLIVVQWSDQRRVILWSRVGHVVFHENGLKNVRFTYYKIFVNFFTYFSCSTHFTTKLGQNCTAPYIFAPFARRIGMERKKVI